MSFREATGAVSAAPMGGAMTIWQRLPPRAYSCRLSWGNCWTWYPRYLHQELTRWRRYNHRPRMEDVNGAHIWRGANERRPRSEQHPLPANTLFPGSFPALSRLFPASLPPLLQRLPSLCDTRRTGLHQLVLTHNNAPFVGPPLSETKMSTVCSHNPRRLH